jgi:integrase
MPLTDAAVRNAKPGAKPDGTATPKPYKMGDAGGLYMEVAPTGGKWWRLKYRFGGKEKRLALGVYPSITLAEARQRRDEARRLLAQGIDPGEHRKLTKNTLPQDADSFEAVAREWHAKFAPTWTAEHAARILQRLTLNVFPWIGARPVGKITAPELLAVLRRIEARAHQNCGAVFRYAVATGRAERDPSADLRGALPPASKRHHAAIIDPKAIAELLRVLDGYTGSFVTACALRLAPLLFVRPGELRRAEWAEIDLDAAEWRIPAAKMKMRAPHVVPLADQALAILRELHPLTGRGRYVFPGARSADRPMSENTVNAALRRLGYDKDVMTGHGFRTLASTTLHEQGWPSDIIERQLAHAERNKIKAAYNRAEHLPERRRMMQAWADYLDSLKAGADVVPFRHSRSASRFGND